MSSPSPSPPNVSVVVPWKGGCEHRTAALKWCLNRWKQAGFTVKLGLCHGPWVKALAVEDGMSKCRDADVIVVADSDVWCDGIQLAVDAVASGATAWAVPHRRVRRLDRSSTVAVYAGGVPQQGRLTQDPYTGVAGGGLTVVTAEVYAQVPLDARFVGWGQEDESWGFALTTMVGPPWRGTIDLWHLWHPPQPRLNRVIGSDGGKQLRDRYRAARSDPAAMAALLSGSRNG